MNFARESLKPKAKLRNEDFYFQIETPRGHFFAVLDFYWHDYANLNATLKGKLETIVGSFASLEDFSDIVSRFCGKRVRTQPEDELAEHSEWAESDRAGGNPAGRLRRYLSKPLAKLRDHRVNLGSAGAVCLQREVSNGSG